METRQEVLEFGLLPLGLVLPWIDSLEVLGELHLKLLAASRQLEGRKGVIDLQSLQNQLNIVPSLWDVLYDALDVIASKPVGFKWTGRSEIHSIDTHAFSLFLMLQIYGQQVQRGDHEDWQDRTSEKPSTADSVPHSPGGRLNSPLRAHSILSFPSFLRRNIQYLLFLILDNPPAITSSAWTFSRGQSSLNMIIRRSEERLWITASEVDRLGIFLRQKDQIAVENGSSKVGSYVPGIGDWKRLSSWMPCFRGKTDDHQVACEEVANWLVANILDNDIEKPNEESGEAAVKIHGMSKGTVVKGENYFPGKELRVYDCQDSCIYALAPVNRVKVWACTDCTIVIGAAQSLIVSTCSKVRIICTCWRASITSCHECTIHLGTNRPPVLYGDNRYLQLAPYNTSYERLPSHMRQMGIKGSPNLWDQPLVLSRHRASEDGDISIVAMNGISSTNEDGDCNKYKSWMLPPENLLPFTIPFKGSGGQLAGGSSTVSQLSWLGKGGIDAPGTGRSPGLPFALPEPYLDAIMMKLQKVTELQESVGKAIVDSNNRRDLHVAIQGYFKDWLFNSGRIRQVYDLAKLEQQSIAEKKRSSSSKLQAKNH